MATKTEDTPTTFELMINPSRVCYALGKIGYSPESAICDIIDNSVSAKAKNLFILLNKRKDIHESRKNSAEEYVIIDDGNGMDLNEIGNALALGSSNEKYQKNTLSKFGMGLKSAGFSQGKRIEIISFKSPSLKHKVYVDLAIIEKENSYKAHSESINEDDNELISKYLNSSKSGTIVRIKKIHDSNHPSIKNTQDKLKSILGVTYYYFLKEKSLNLQLNDHKIEPVDVLFSEEATSNLDKSKWDGKEVCWIQKQRSIVIDPEKDITAKLEITQLPHPPSFEADPNENKTKLDVRKKYLINQNNYGFYIYRNKRLISWASKLQDIIPSDQDYFAFRGRILLDSKADETVNIDVKKSRILLSEEAYDAISDCVMESKRLSKDAWKNRSYKLKKLAGETPESISEDSLNNFNPPEILPTDKDNDKALIEAKKRLEKMVDKYKPRNNKLNPDNNFRKIQFLDYIEDNTLWDYTHDPEHGVCARVNKHHRFIKELSRLCEDSPYSITAIHVFFYSLAVAESHTIRHFTEIPDKTIQDVLLRFRDNATQILTQATKDSLENLKI